MNYPIRLTVCALLLSISNLSAATLYASLGSTNPTPPYATWATAATNIQDAVDAAAAGDEVVVTNGVYPGGLGVNGPLAVRSVNGPRFTVIDGGYAGINGVTPGVGNQCASLANGGSLSGFTLTNGVAPSGGGVWCSTSAFLTNCVIAGNAAGSWSGEDPDYGPLWAGGEGGGAYGGTLYNCTLTGNGAGQGGGVFGSTLYNCTLSGNGAWVGTFQPGNSCGGGAYGSTLHNCTLSGNSVSQSEHEPGGAYGGGAYGGTLNNCTLSGNSASTTRGAATSAGGGAYGCTLNNCTLTDNMTWGDAGGAAGECMLCNCILYFNGTGNYDQGGSSLNYCCTTPLPTNGVGNITGDPLFLDYANGNLRLQPASPCVDAGDNACAPGPVDLDGNPRIVNGTVDIGAYELQGSPSGPPFFLSQPASLTNEAETTVTFSVLAAGAAPLSYQWLKQGVPLADGPDIAGSGTPVLTLTNVLGADAGGYSVAVSNGLGSATSALATLTVIDPAIAVQPVSQIGQLGQTLTLSVTAAGTPPLSYQWWKEGVALAWGTGASLTLTNLRAADAGDYRVVVSNQYGSVTSAAALLAVNLATLDSGFNPGADATVFALALQADGKILVGGSFPGIGGGDLLERLNPDGTLDSGFNSGAGSSQPGVTLLAVQADGEILVGGGFSTLDGQSCNGIGRLNADGTLDSAFNPGAEYGVYSLALQADGKILVGGGFSTLGGQPCTALGRLNADGTLDSGFNPGAGAGGGSPFVYSLALQADGKILVGGYFSTLCGQTRNYIGRLNADGTLDNAFNPGANGEVDSLAVQADGKILVGGDFTTLGGQSCNCIGRLNADGTPDTSFNAAAGAEVVFLALQADGKILVGGWFSTLGGQPRSYLGRLNADGTVDSAFNPGANNAVDSLALQADGKILVGGYFTNLAGQPRQCLGRLNNTEPATQSLSFDGSTITWLRGGASPEVWRTTFDFSTNGINWTSLGAGARIAGLPAGQAGGWQLTSVSLPSPRGAIRARGYVTGGEYNGSSWFVETDLVPTSGPPVFISQPASLTNDPGTTATFSVVAGGPEPLGYQWRKDGVPLADGGNIAGAATAMLVLTNVFGGDAGGYSVVVSNGFGSVTSALATLAVMDPLIAVQPESQLALPGQSVTFSVTAAGTSPFSYQWWKEGVALPWGTGASLTLTNLQATDAGDYSVVVSNQYGSVTSAVALLAVNLATLDSGFSPVANGTVCALALQADGKILVGGGCISRLNADGTLDSSFNAWSDEGVDSLAVQADGKILVGGAFFKVDGQWCYNIGRLNADGTLDGTLDGAFGPGTVGVACLALQADGKILVGGGFAGAGGTENNIARLNADGTEDSAFNPGANGEVYSLAVQGDGKILVGGDFSTLGGQPRQSIGRLNADGTVDSGFNPGAGGNSPYSPYVYSLAVQADGKILVGGFFATLCGQTCNYIGRLNADGTLDTGFNPGAAVPSGAPALTGGSVHCLAVQADGKILVGGFFTTLAEQPCHNIARLNADGTLDSAFDPGADNQVYSLAVQPDGKVLVGGYFSTLCGQTCNYLGRVNNTEPATQSLDFDGSTITWLRGGASPEVWRTTFDFSTDGTNWTSLGAGARLAGGWYLNRVSLPSTNGTIRARGYLETWFVETDVVGPPPVGPGVAPALAAQPQGATNLAGSTVTFSAAATGTAPLSFQWRRDGLPLADGGNIAGAWTAVLTLANVGGGDAGGYSLVVTNQYGSVTSAVATLTVIDPVIAVQPVSQIGQGGQSLTLSVTAAGTAPLGYQWSKDGGALAWGTGASLTLTNLQAPDAGDYSVLVSDQYGSVTSTVAVLTVNVATLDSGFNPGASGEEVFSLALQADGKILVGGWFTTLGGQTRNYIGRLNADGTLDSGFNPGAGGNSPYSPYVSSLAVQADGKILVGGYFTTLGGQMCNHIGRLNADGTLDTGFNPGAAAPYGAGVPCLAVQADGKILVGGLFTMLGGQSRTNIGRLNADGTLDSSFNPEPNDSVCCLALQADGKILVGGPFTMLGGQTRNYLGRLNADGTLDNGFNPGADNSVYSLAVQADGKILVGGYFTTLGGQTRNYLGRLNADGTLDGGFNPGAGGNSPYSPYVNSLAVQADGKILVGGNFSTLGGQSGNYIGRLNADGTADTSFIPGPDSCVCSLALQADGKILVGGNFSTLAGQTRDLLGRLNNSEPATQSLGYDGSTITWLRGGASPEVWRTTFEFSNDSTNWTSLGAGTRIAGLPAGQAGGWQLTSVSLPSTNGAIRARGYVTGGQYNGSSWFVESDVQLTGAPTSGPPVFISQPASRTNDPGTTATFSVVAAGVPEPLGYQWRKDGAPLVDGGNIAGAATAVLVLTNVLGGDAGGYSVVVSNSFASVTSALATLVVIDPLIAVQPVSQLGQLGDSVTFSVTAVGTAPFGYQWWKDAAALAGGTAASLTLTNLQAADAGGYSVVVSNQFGSVTSAVALLTVNLATLDSVFNPDFSAPALPSGTFFQYDPPTAPGQPWVFIGQSGVANDYKGDPTGAFSVANIGYSGQYAFIQHYDGLSGSVSQAVTFTSAGAYLLSFSAAGRVPADLGSSAGFSGGNLLYTVEVAPVAGGPSVLDVTNTSVNSQPFTNITCPFIIPAPGDYQISFASLSSYGANPDDNTVLITDVSLSYVAAWGNPSILAPPLTQTAEMGSLAGFWLEVTNAAPGTTYQWYFNGTNALGVTTNCYLVLANVQPAQAGAYMVVVTNLWGAVASAPAMLSVIAPVERSIVPALNLTGDVGSFLQLDYVNAFGPGAQWMSLTNVTIQSAPQLCFDLSESLPARRFYRAWQTNGPPPALEMSMATEIPLTGAIGSSVQIDYINQFGPTNAWVTLDTVTLTNTTQLYFDVTMFRQPTRLYRLVVGPTNTAPANMVLIPAGSFQMGDPLDGETDAPLHPVYVSAFYMDTNLVSYALWQQVYQWATNHGYGFDNAGSGKAASHPVQSIDWYDCVKWCNARSEMEGRTPAYYTDASNTAVYRSGDIDLDSASVNWSAGYRLPTEAEWEKAARGGLSGYRFPWGDTIDWSHANYEAESGFDPTFDDGVIPYTSPVGYFAPNGYGLYDMAGNVWEWCWDWYGTYPAGGVTDPQGPGAGSYRVFRGGSWQNYAWFSRSAYRGANADPVVSVNYLGFRVLLAPGQP